MACQLHSVDFGPNVDRVTRVHPECQFAYSCVDQLCDSAWTAAMVRFPPAHNSFVRLDFNQYSVAFYSTANTETHFISLWYPVRDGKGANVCDFHHALLGFSKSGWTRSSGLSHLRDVRKSSCTAAFLVFAGRCLFSGHCSVHSKPWQGTVKLGQYMPWSCHFEVFIAIENLRPVDPRAAKPGCAS